MPDPNTEHGLQVQLATALKERDEMALRAEHFAARILAAESERDALRATLTEVNNLLMSVPEGADWRQIVRKKVVLALHGEPTWEEL